MQQSLFEDLENFKGKEATHTGGKGEVFHDWYPYLEGFSSNFVDGVRKKYLPNAKTILEPFGGVGTTPIYLSIKNVKCIYSEVNPVLTHLIDAKSHILSLSSLKRKNLIKELQKIILEIEKINSYQADEDLEESYKFLFKKSIYFENKNLKLILKLKSLVNQINDLDVKKLINVAIYSSLLSCSLLKRAGDVRYRTKKDLIKDPPKDIKKQVTEKIILIINDLKKLEKTYLIPKLFCNNAKDLIKKKEKLVDGVITSPPYLNGTNYFRNTKLELWFMGFINKEIGLNKFRSDAVTAGINDVSKIKKDLLIEVKETYTKLKKNAYDNRIPKMVLDYFYDMKLVMQGLKKHTKKKGVICIDIGDSIYAGVHVPTDNILIKISENIGLKLIDNQLLRVRTSHNKEKLTQRLLVFEN